MNKKLAAGIAAVVMAISTFTLPATAVSKDDVITTPPANGQVTPNSFWCRVIPWLPDCRFF